MESAQYLKARTHDATLRATSRVTWKLHRVSTLEIVARNCFTVCPSSATLCATSRRKSCAQWCIVCPCLNTSKIRTQAKPVGGESSYYCTIPAPLSRLQLRRSPSLPWEGGGERGRRYSHVILVGVYLSIFQSRDWRTGWAKISDQNR